MTPKYKFHAYKKCLTCKGTGTTGETIERPYFNSTTMEMSLGSDEEKCPDCAERSLEDYQDALEQMSDREREESE